MASPQKTTGKAGRPWGWFRCRGTRPGFRLCFFGGLPLQLLRLENREIVFRADP